MATRRPDWRERVNGAWRALRGRPSPLPTQHAAPPDAAPLVALRSAPGQAGVVPSATMNTDTAYSSPFAAPALHGGRQSQPANYSPFGLNVGAYIQRREYQDLDLASLNVADYDAGQLLTLLADLNPDVSRALWNVLRVAGVGLTLQVTTPAGKDDTVGQALVNGLLGRVNHSAGGLTAVLTQMLLTAYLQGAVCLDVAPTENLRDVEDLYPVNPGSIFYQRDANQVPVPFQYQAFFWGTGTVPYRRLNTELFAYTPIDPYVDDVYGRPPAAPVLQVVFFQVQVLRDLERVLHAQGWPKIDVSVLTDVLMKNVPPDVRVDTNKMNHYMADRMNEIAGAYNKMNPEDAFIHPDYVVVSSEAAKAGSNLFDVAGLLAVIRAQLISALKQLPVLMGEHLGSTETYSEIELSIFSRSIETFRTPVGQMLAWACGVYLQLVGHQALVGATWDAIPTRARLDVAKADAQEAANAVYNRDQGFVTQDQASIAVTGSKAVAGAPAVTAPVPDNGPPGESKTPATP